MAVPLTPAGYVLTKKKFAGLEARLRALQQRDDLDPVHREEVERSYREMMRLYHRDLKLYEVTRTTTC
jgi:hypothetical protein